MRLSRQFFPQVFLVLFGFSAFLTGCASAPRFDGLREVSDTASLQEALWICGRYELAEPSRRPLDLKPYLTCMDRAVQLHPPAVSSLVPTFLEELKKGYGFLKPDQWTPALGQELAWAIHASLRALWQSPGRRRVMSVREKKAVEHHFPVFAKALGLEDWPTVLLLVDDPALERLRAGLAALDQHGAALSEDCDALKKLRGEAGYLADLLRDSRLLGSTELGRSTEERYRSRVNSALSRLAELRPKILSSPQGTQAECLPRSPNA